MKQSEINAELAARGLNNLEGAARRNAEQTIRLELLYQRSADAVGTFAEQEGTLYVEQKKLGATFENFQATLGDAVIPSVATLNTLFRELLEDITPGMQGAFSFLAEILTGVVTLIQDAMDPNSDLGESVAALAIQFESLFKTIFGQDATIATVFEIAGVALGMFLDLMHDLLRIIESIIIFFQVMGEAMTLFFTDIEAFFAFDQGEELKRRLDIRDTVNNNKLAVKQYIAEWDRVRALELSGHLNQVSMTADQMERLARASASVRPMLTGTADNMERQINAMNRATQSTVAAVATVRSSLASTPGSSASSTSAASVANTERDASRDLQNALDDAARREEERLRQREDSYKSFADSVKSIFGSIKESILSAFNLSELGNSVNSITRNIQKLLTRTKDFARNITSLSQQGLTNDLLQQVIAAGPIQGGRLAQSLAGAGGSFISQLNQAYGEFGSIASDIAGVGTRSAFGNAQVVNTYNIEVNGGVGSGPTIGKAIVDAIKSYERTSGAVWQGA
jgi:hypothetical protein